MTKLERLNTLYRNRFNGWRDRELWDEVIEDEWHRIAAVLDAAIRMDMPTLKLVVQAFMASEAEG
jgi:hypothetical protein